MLDDRDLRIETFTGGAMSDVAMRITHLPTGKTVSAVGESRTKLRQQLLIELAAVVEKGVS